MLQTNIFFHFGQHLIASVPSMPTSPLHSNPSAHHFLPRNIRDGNYFLFFSLKIVLAILEIIWTMSSCKMPRQGAFLLQVISDRQHHAVIWQGEMQYTYLPDFGQMVFPKAPFVDIGHQCRTKMTLQINCHLGNWMPQLFTVMWCVCLRCIR